MIPAIIAVLSGCTTAPPTVIRDTVGPALARAQARNGTLMVYSGTAWMTNNDDGPALLVHTSYEIGDRTDGALIKQVVNGDDEPERVTLPEGHYTVVAQSDNFGTVIVPVAVEAGKTTALHLEREKDWRISTKAGTDLVRLPNGQPIGIRARRAVSIEPSTSANNLSRRVVAAHAVHSSARGGGG